MWKQILVVSWLAKTEKNQHCWETIQLLKVLLRMQATRWLAKIQKHPYWWRNHSTAQSATRIENQATLMRNHSAIKVWQEIQAVRSLAKTWKIHTDEKPFSCFNCNKKFSQAVNLKVHERIYIWRVVEVDEQCEKEERYPWRQNGMSLLNQSSGNTFL